MTSIEMLNDLKKYRKIGENDHAYVTWTVHLEHQELLNQLKSALKLLDFYKDVTPFYDKWHNENIDKVREIKAAIEKYDLPYTAYETQIEPKP